MDLRWRGASSIDVSYALLIDFDSCLPAGAFDVLENNNLPVGLLDSCLAALRHRNRGCAIAGGMPGCQARRRMVDVQKITPAEMFLRTPATFNIPCQNLFPSTKTALQKI